jgi:uncharacterized 2Fe-2S/4Fe-4S cluster protein (DUF4445 family)
MKKQPMEGYNPLIVFQPAGCRGRFPRRTTLAEASALFGVPLQMPCGENGVCGKCKVRIEDGPCEALGITSSRDGLVQAEQSDFIGAEESAAGVFLACRSMVMNDVLVFVPEESRAGESEICKEARNIPILYDPAVKNYFLTVHPSTLSDPTPDFERIAKEIERQYGLRKLQIDLHALRDLPFALRTGE